MTTGSREQTDQSKQNPINFAPAFTKEQAFKLEDEYNTTWGVNRRIMMMILSKSSDAMSDMLVSIISEDSAAETYFAMVEQISDYEQHLKYGIELAQSATARLLLVTQNIAGDEAERV